MARTRTTVERDGKLFYPLSRGRKIEVPGTKGLKFRESVEVPQLPTEGTLDDLLTNALNMVEGASDQAKVEKLIGIINAGLVAAATTAIQTKLNASIAANKVVDDFTGVVKLMAGMYPNMSENERATMILEKFPDIAQRLKDAGLEPAGEDDEDEVEDDE